MLSFGYDLITLYVRLSCDSPKLLNFIPVFSVFSLSTIFFVFIFFCCKLPITRFILISKMVVDWSDAARYAYASLFALSLNERYSESCDAQFRQQSLHHLLEHVKLMRVNTCHLFVCTIS